jgi:hypothetical protein
MLLVQLHASGKPLFDHASPWVGLTSSATSNNWEFLRGARSVEPDDRCSLWEAKCIHQFNHRFATYSEVGEAARLAGNPRAFIELSDSASCICPRYTIPRRLWLDHVAERQSYSSYSVGYRDVARSTDERTMIAACLPFGGFMQPLNGISASTPESLARLLACLNSFPLDYACRQKTPGTHVNVTICKQLPVVGQDKVQKNAITAQSSWMESRVLELTYTTWELESFAHDVGYDGPPFRWDPNRRFLLRCELDAAFFHLYGLSRDDTNYVMDTFPIVRKNDEKAHGEYRTKRVILEMYDAMAEAARTGEPYQTRLDPPAADPRVAHAESTRPAWAKKGAS